ncbi:hypothetical protein GQ457_02G031490 [Hibiscus cannabinus]
MDSVVPAQIKPATTIPATMIKKATCSNCIKVDEGSKAEDSFSGINVPGNMSNQLGSNVTPVNVEHVYGLTLLAYLWLKFTMHLMDSTPPSTHGDPSTPRSHSLCRETNAVAFAGLNSQNSCMITIANAVFRSKPHLNPDVLAKSFQLDKKLVTFHNGSGCLWVVVSGFKRSSKLRAVQSPSQYKTQSQPKSPMDYL